MRWFGRTVRVLVGALVGLGGIGCGPDAPEQAAAPAATQPDPATLPKPAPGEVVTPPEPWCFDAPEAKRRQRQSAQGLGVPVQRTVTLPGGVGLELVLIPPGEFRMGSRRDEMHHDDAKPVHRVRLTRAFYMGRYEVTQAQWRALVGHNPSFFPAYYKAVDPTRFAAPAETDRRPVEQVSWIDIQTVFLPKLNTHAPRGWTFRLPTEAEWEYACRAGTSTPFHGGDSLGPDQANIGLSRQLTTKVGSFPPNAWGLSDMHGNVAEWCLDGYDPTYYARGGVDDPCNTRKTRCHVARGGHWFLGAYSASSAARDAPDDDDRKNTFGCRVALVPSSPAPATQTTQPRP